MQIIIDLNAIGGIVAHAASVAANTTAWVAGEALGYTAGGVKNVAGLIAQSNSIDVDVILSDSESELKTELISNDEKIKKLVLLVEKLATETKKQSQEINQLVSIVEQLTEQELPEVNPSSEKTETELINLDAMSIVELRELARSKNINYKGIKKPELVKLLYVSMLPTANAQ